MFDKHLPTDLRAAVARCREHFAFAALFSAAVNVLFLAPTLYMMQVYDRVVPTGGVGTLIWITLILAVALGVLASFDALRGRLMTRAAMRLNRDLAPAIIERMLQRQQAGGAGSNTNEMRAFDQLRQLLSGPAALAAFDLPWTPLYLIVAFLIHPLLAAIIVAGGAVLIGIAILSERRSRQSMQAGLIANGAAYAAQETAFGNAEIIHALGMRRAFAARLMRSRHDGLVASAQTQIISSRYTALVKFVRMLLQSLALGAGAWLAIEGQISVGAIIAASVLLSRALQPVEQIVGAIPALIEGRAALRRLCVLFDADDSVRPGPVLLPTPKGAVELADVRIDSPDGSRALLQGVSMWVMPGEVVGILGQSGAGKSTLARVVAGAIAPASGKIRIDDADYADWDSERLARHIGYLPQDHGLLPGTLAENISRFAVAAGSHPDDVDRAVVRAATLAGIHEMILHLPGGYNAVIGNGGLRLSGGQAQRISLARALYNDPCLLVLDEPNAALDAAGEDALVRVIQAARARGASIMLVTHRPAILKVANRLIVVADGRIEHQGPRDQVLATLRESAATVSNVVKMNGR